MTDDRTKEDLIAELAEAYRTLDDERHKKQRCSEAARATIRERIGELDARILGQDKLIMSCSQAAEQHRSNRDVAIAERAQLLAFLGEER